MSQSQTGTSLWKGSVPSGSITNGNAIHAREREEEKQRRAQQAPKNSMEAGRAPFFGHLLKVKPSIDDPLQKSIKSVLGDPAIVMLALNSNRHQLLGITGLPPTPVDTKDQGFDYSVKSQDRNDDSEFTRVTEKRKSLEPSNKHPNKFCEKEKQHKKDAGDLHSEKGNITKNGIKNSDNKSLKPPEHQELHQKTTKVTTSTKKSMKSKPDANHVLSASKEKEKSQKGRDSKTQKELHVVSGEASAGKSQHEKVQKHEKHQKHNHSLDNGSSDKKEQETSDRPEKKKKKKSEPTVCTDGLSKPKPAKLIMPKGSSQPNEEGAPLESVPSEVSSVEKILAEMTQPMGPPLTGIKTPIKGGHSSFAFPLNGLKDCATVSPLAKPRKASECKSVEGNLLADDLQISDDDSEDEQVQHKNTSSKPKPNRSGRQRSASASSSSSDSSSGSDSDSSDSDSGSESSDASCSSPAKQPECERSWGLSHIAQASKAKSTPLSTVIPTTKAGASPPALTIGGEDGLRGDQAAPAPNTNLNGHVDPMAQGISMNSLFGSSDGLDSTSFCSVSDLVRDFNDDGTQGFDAVSLPLDLSSLGNEESLHDPFSGSVTDFQKGTCEQEKNSLTVKTPKEGKTHSTKKQSTNLKHEKKPTDKVSKVAKLKKEMAGSKNKMASEKDVVNGVTSKVRSKAKSDRENEKNGKKENKKKVEAKAEAKSDPKIRNSFEKASAKSAKDEDEEDIFVDIESDVGIPLLDGTQLTDNKPKNTTKNKTTAASKPQKTSSKTSNGVDFLGHHNGEKVNPSMVSPARRKNGLKDFENTVNGYSKPDSLLVKIDLALLKRVPKLPRGNQAMQNKEVDSFPTVVNGSVHDASRSSTMKIPKRPSSVDKSGEQPDAKKARNESKKNSDLNNRKETSRKARERLNSASSTGSREDSQRKRSPNGENERHSKKRRHNSESSRGHKIPMKQETHTDKMREPNRDEMDDRARCCSCEGKKAEKKKDLLVSSFYEDDLRVQHGPDHYLVAAKRLKHTADSLSDKESKVNTYVEAVLNFVRCGKALEQNKDTETRSAYQMYSETLDFMRYIMRAFINRPVRCDVPRDKRLAGLCMRLQALIYMHMYKLKKEHMMASSKTLTDHFRGPPKGAQAPSPYNPASAKMTETPSPMSPTPSPSGSVGSTSSNEAVATPSRNGKLCSGSSSMTSPVNISVPQKIHSMTAQHLIFTNTLLYSHEIWSTAQDIVLSNKDFFMDLDRRFGPLTLHSSMVHAVNYVEQGLKMLKNTT